MIVNIIVNTNEEQSVERYIKEINRQLLLPDLTLIVVDNSSTLKKFRINLLCKKYKLIILKPKKNLGYYGGAKFGLNFYLKKYGLNFDYLIVSNHDILFLDKLFFKKLSYLNAKSKKIIYSPLVLRGRSRREWFAHTDSRPSKKQVRKLNFILSNIIISYFYNFLSMTRHLILDKFVEFRKKHYYKKSIYTSVSKKIYAPNGAFTILPSSFFKKGGNLNLFCFIYGEEIFIAEQARKLKFDIKYFIKLKLLHIGYSKLNLFKDIKVLKWKKDAVSAYYKRYFH